MGVYIYIYIKINIAALNQPAVTKIYWKGVNTGVLNEHQELQQGSRQSRVKTVKEKRQKESGKVKMMKKRRKLMRKKVALTDTRQKKLLTQISPQNITAGAWESHWSRQSKKRSKRNRAKSRWWRKEGNWWGRKWHWLTLGRKSCWLRKEGNWWGRKWHWLTLGRKSCWLRKEANWWGRKWHWLTLGRKSCWLRKEGNWWGRKWHWLTLGRNSCWLSFPPRTSQQGPGTVNGGSCHKYNFCRNKSFVTVSIFCHNERRFVVVTNTILEQYATLTDNGCKIMDTC